MMSEMVAFVRNKSTEEMPWAPLLNPQQKFNYGLLEELCRHKTVEQSKTLREDLLRHGWDPAVVEQAFLDKTLIKFK